MIDNILVVGAACHQFDEVNVCTLCTLTAGISRVAPHDNFTDFVQVAMGFINVPTSLQVLTTLEGVFSPLGPTDPQPLLAG